MNKTEKRGARIRVPATTANLGAAFDAVGVALRLYLTVEVKELNSSPSRLDFRGEDAHVIPTDETNLIWRTMVEVATREKRELPSFSLEIENQIPITKGLGSSASACLAGAAAADFLCRLNLSRERLLEIGVMKEGHPDNVAPALWGGLVASIAGEKILCSRSEFPSHWTFVAVTPDCELETKKARNVLPTQVSHRDAVYNVQRAAFLMGQLTQGRREGLREAMRDRLHQPYRSALVPGLQEIFDMKDSDGLLGVALSGAGSTVIALAESHEEEIAECMREIFFRNGLTSAARLLKADNTGLVVEQLTIDD